MRLSIPIDVHAVFASLQTHIVDMHYACHDEQGRLRPTHFGSRAELYCQNCVHNGKATCIHAGGSYTRKLAQQRERERKRSAEQWARSGYSEGKVCAWPGCNARINNRATYCKRHGQLARAKAVHA
jgi:hypothetical protein